MVQSKRLSAICCCLLILNAITLYFPVAECQELAADKRPELNLVRVNITTVAKQQVELQGHIIPNFRIKVVNQFPPYTGIVIDDDGHIVVFLGYTWVFIDQRNPQVEVVDLRGQKRPASLIGIDQSARLAVFICESAALKRSPLHEQLDLKDGDLISVPLLDSAGLPQLASARVLAISNGGEIPGGNGWSIGIDQLLNVVGAPLFNARGEVLGLIANEPEVAVAASPQGSVTTILPDIIPAKLILNVANRIINAGGDIRSGWLGVRTDSEAGPGVLIKEIVPESPASNAGLRADDTITKWNGKIVRDPLVLIQTIESTRIGAKASVEFLRKGKTLQTSVVIEARKREDQRLMLTIPQMMSLFGQQFTSYDALLQSSLGIQVLAMSPKLASALQLPVQTGLFITDLKTGSALASAGLTALDVILTVNGVQIQNPQTFYNEVRASNSGDVVVRFLHRGKELTKAIKLPRLVDTPD
jgi:S1-C subfamily serine protease